MPLVNRQTIAGLGQPLSSGRSVLIAGAIVNVAITGHSTNAIVVGARLIAGGVIGDLTFVFDFAAGTLTITSANGADTSTVGWMITG